MVVMSRSPHGNTFRIVVGLIRFSARFRRADRPSSSVLLSVNERTGVGPVRNRVLRGFAQDPRPLRSRVVQRNVHARTTALDKDGAMLANDRVPRHTSVQQRVRSRVCGRPLWRDYRSPAENRVRKSATLTISMPRNPTSRSRSSSPVTMVCEPALTAHSSTRLYPIAWDIDEVTRRHTVAQRWSRSDRECGG